MEHGAFFHFFAVIIKNSVQVFTTSTATVHWPKALVTQACIYPLYWVNSREEVEPMGWFCSSQVILFQKLISCSVYGLYPWHQ